MIRILIAEDHELLRQGLRSLLEDEKEIRIVAEAANGKVAIDYLETTPVDLLLLDINMPVMNGIETAHAVSNTFPQIKILVLSMLDDPHYVQKLREAGVAGYILKKTGKAELMKAIRTVMAGKQYLSPELQAKLQRFEQQGTGSGEKIIVPTEREKQILELIAAGYSNQEIADKIFLSRRTVESHRKKLIEKTNCKSTGALIRYAISKGFIKSDTILQRRS